MYEAYEPTIAAAHARIAAVRPSAYARTRNAVGGAVSGLSPYITHGFVTLPEVLAGVTMRQALPVQHKFVFELGWREYFRHVWRHRGDGILRSLHEGPLPESAYLPDLPGDLLRGCTGVPAIDLAVRTLYATGQLHNHARMWLASYVVHLRKVHWRSGADWLYGHLLDGDLGSNHLSWQWVAGTGSHRAYLFNADNVARHAPEAWHSGGTAIDASYDELDRIARCATPVASDTASDEGVPEPALLAEPPQHVAASVVDPDLVRARDVWLVHPWSLGALPALPADTLVLGVYVADFHRAWPWSERRWRFVGSRMATLAEHRWIGEAAEIGAALAGARRVRCLAEPHLLPWLTRWADCEASPELFPPVVRRCDSFSQWWTRATRGLQSTNELLAVQEVAAC